MVRSPGNALRTTRLTFSPRSPAYLEGVRPPAYDFNAFVAQNPLHLSRATSKSSRLRIWGARLNDGHVAAKATESLRKFEAGIAARRLSADATAKWSSSRASTCVSGRAASRPENVWKGRVRSEVEEDGVRRKHASVSVIQGNLERFPAS